MIKGAKKPLLYFAAGTAVLVSAGAYTWSEAGKDPRLHLYIFDVPGTPAMFIRTPEDYRLLINGGSNSEIIRHITRIIPFYSRRIDAVMSTNTDGQYVGGLIDVIKRYNVSRAYFPKFTKNNLGISTTDQIFRTFLDSLSGEIVYVEEGDKVELGHHAYLDVLFPATQESFSYSNASGPEIIFSINYGETSVLYIGKSSSKTQKYVSRQGNTESDILITYQSPVIANLPADVISNVQPKYLIYRAREEPGKEKTGNIAAILMKNRFNIYGTEIKIASDGRGLDILRPEPRHY